MEKGEREKRGGGGGEGGEEVQEGRELTLTQSDMPVNGTHMGNEREEDPGLTTGGQPTQMGSS